MPRTKSALKAARASARKQIKNSIQSNQLDKLLRAFKKAVEPTTEQLSGLQKAIDKAAKTGLVHRGKADRMKSRLFTKRTEKVAAPKVTKSKKSAKRASKPKKK